ncbi:succinate dehydrogenase assembly factor 2 [Xanthomonas sp. XNM01]|uniref:FAD assembly factor SdhE n=1 Tax=Xanthomonas sp. XNM01 TaxID=2769289 RepID=UPI0017817959|nr:succinate dehydrogenase assembly factor 2 [Xanthomonas sp. XNM01]MBD9367942.1 succinate dehydrogenase assembly factor 2 [Xanthomonas sp. XNM01]
MQDPISQAVDLAEPAELKRIRWRCRRGMRELDQLFERYLARLYPQASEAQRVVFLRLLECEDDKLWRWFMGYEACPDAELAALIADIRALPA